MDRILAIDCGKDDTKISAYNSDGSVELNKIKTRVGLADELSKLSSETSSDIHIFKYDNKEYYIGSPSGTTTDSNSKQDNIHKIMTLFAIAISVNNNDNVKVAIGCPLVTFIDADARQEYLDYILPKGKVTVEVNGSTKSFYISKRECLPESFGALFMYPDEFKNCAAGVIDIGALNINCCYFNNSKLVTDNCFTDKYGKLQIARKLKSKLNQKYDAQFKTFEVEHFLEDRQVPNSPESKDIIQGIINTDLDDIRQACKDNGWNIDYCKLMFIGGTSKLLKNEIMERYPNALIPDASEYTNVCGFLKYLLMKDGLTCNI